MSNPLVTKEEISSYIPQKHPMVMIDTIDVCEGNVTRTSFKIESDNIFVKNGILHEPGIIENIAQTAAAKAGYEVKKLGKEPLIGFIGAVKDLKIYDFPKIEEVLETLVEVKTEVMDVTIINGSSSVGGRKIAECEMKIFLQKPDQNNAQNA